MGTNITALLQREPPGVLATVLFTFAIWLLTELWRVHGVPAVANYMYYDLGIRYGKGLHVKQRRREWYQEFHYERRPVPPPEVVTYRAFSEEVRYRIIPLSLALLTGSLGILFLTASVSSVVFGLAHKPFLFVLVDTTGFGMCMCYLFLQTGGMNRKLIKPSLCIGILHTMHNLAVYGYFPYPRLL